MAHPLDELAEAVEIERAADDELRQVERDGELPLGRATASLSPGEAKRVVLARALARADVDGGLVLLDEPAAGLSADDVERLIDATEQLRARGATVVVTEHRAAVIAASDWIVELGPGAGPRGGRVVVQGTLEDVRGCEASVTRRALDGGAQGA